MTTHTTTVPRASARPADSGRWLIWAAGLVVAAGAAVATAHGLYRVALAATVPPPIGWLYPLITDGLALVAYAATTRLTAGGRRYAWAVVVLAAGLSGLAQASYLAIGVHTAPVQLRFGVGAWPAVAAAITAHLLYLLAARPTAVQPPPAARPTAVQPPPAGRADVGRLDTHEPLTVGQPTVGRSDSGVGPAPVGHARPAVRVAPVGHGDPDVGRPGHSRPSKPQAPAGGGMPDGTRWRLGDPLSRPDGTHPPGLPAAGTATDQQRTTTVRPAGVQPVAVQPGPPDVGHHPVRQAVTDRSVQPADVGHVHDVQPDPPEPGGPAAVQPGHPVGQPARRSVDTVGHPPDGDRREPADEAPVDRARTAALTHQAGAGALPSVRTLADAADVSRGTAATALQQLRDLAAAPRPGLRVVPDQADIESTR